MGKQTKVQLVVGTMVRLAIALVDWLPEFNVSRADQTRILPKGRQNKATGEVQNGGVWENIRDAGWRSELPAQFIVLSYEHNKLATAENIIAERRKRIKLWQESEDTVALANLMGDIWFPGGKPVIPLVIGNSGNGRGLSLPYILLDKVQRAAAAGETYDASTFDIPGVIMEFPGEKERVIEQSQENESRRMPGVADASWPDRLVSARFLLRQKGGNENTLRKAYGQVGTAQKVYRILKADGEFPDVHLLDRIRMPRPEGWKRTADNYVKGGYVPAASLDKEQLKKVLDGEGSLEAYIKKMYAGGANRPPVTDRTVWDAATGAYQVQPGSPFALIRQCHLDGIGFADVFAKYPELASANYFGSTKADTKADKALTKDKVKASK